MEPNSGRDDTLRLSFSSFTFLSDPDSYLPTSLFTVKSASTFSKILPALFHWRDIPNQRSMSTHACLKILACGLIYQYDGKRKSAHCFQEFTSGFFSFVSFHLMLTRSLPFLSWTSLHTSFSFFTQTLFFSPGSFVTTQF
jgi:hypothetical protein